MNLANRIAKLEASAAPRSEVIVALWLDTGRGDFVHRGYFGRPEPCANVEAVLAEAAGQGFAPKIYLGLDPDDL
ncbi:MAG TPA: hypothetical protein VEL76_13290 [Gemmataceae bacterium]|nr:hypothetical protein [Gemmataceae bacterium]